MQRVKQRVSVLDILNLHMSSNSYKRWNLRLQPHSTKQLLLLHNYNIQNESLSQQAIYTSDAERRFRRACDQIVLLNQKLGEVQKRYKNARRTNNRSFRYNLRLKLAVVEGVRNMYYDYAYAKADQVADLRRELFNESVEIVSGSDSDYMSDTE